MPIKNFGGAENAPQNKQQRKATKADEVRMTAVEGQDTQGLKAAARGGKRS
jgi:hypothetical protein